MHPDVYYALRVVRVTLVSCTRCKSTEATTSLELSIHLEKALALPELWLFHDGPCARSLILLSRSRSNEAYLEEIIESDPCA